MAALINLRYFILLGFLWGHTLGLINLSPNDRDKLEEIWGNDWTFTGILTFAHLPYTKCLADPEASYDIAILGAPFDTATMYRTGARFGPRTIRSASLRQNKDRGFNFRAGLNPYSDWAKVIDCGDIPITPVDNELALHQMVAGYENVLSHKTNAKENEGNVPRIVMLGGDHSVLLSALRNLYKVYGPITVLQFDAHLDTWNPNTYPSFNRTSSPPFNHGSMLWMAHEEGIISNDTNVHAGLRTRLGGVGWDDYEMDAKQGFSRIESDEIMDIGVQGIVDKIKKRIPKDAPVYISVDIDVLDPSNAPGTGALEAGGWFTRELIQMLRRLDHLNIVGAEVVEVNPLSDIPNAEITALAAAQIAFEIATSMVKKGPLKIKANKQTRKGDHSYFEWKKEFPMSGTQIVL
ncbi:uncharacterized protein PRCAT00004230001 [Priceomyces carsonii]|uniref:uncharacterized protein n=1 Tax=Priceomyces carsonii TaxID=28549 RepID=UPI002ED9970A|nr:unnamed protein product [Priceomyces carsonii]